MCRHRVLCGVLCGLSYAGLMRVLCALLCVLCAGLVRRSYALRRAGTLFTPDVRTSSSSKNCLMRVLCDVLCALKMSYASYAHLMPFLFALFLSVKHSVYIYGKRETWLFMFSGIRPGTYPIASGSKFEVESVMRCLRSSFGDRFLSQSCFLVSKIG